MMYDGGYDWFNGMSNRAVRAYSEGKLPVSKITLAALRAAGWHGTKKAALAYRNSGEWKSCEWHHTSKHYNRTYFFDLSDVVEIQERIAA